MTDSHETPVASETDTIHNASKRTVAPRWPSACSNPLPTTWPRIPPAVSRMTGARICSVANPQLVASNNTNPPVRHHTTGRATALSRFPDR